MQGNATRSGKDQNRYYTCASRSRGLLCGGRKSLRADDFERVIVREFQACLLEVQEQIHAELKKQSGRKKASKSGAVKQLQKTVATLDRKIARGIENLALADAANVPALEELLSGWRQQRAQAGEQLRATDRAQDKPRDAARQVERAIKELANLDAWLQHGEADKIRYALGTMIEGITVWWAGDNRPDERNWTRSAEKVLIRFKQDDGQSASTPVCATRDTSTTIWTGKSDLKVTKRAAWRAHSRVTVRMAGRGVREKWCRSTER